MSNAKESVSKLLETLQERSKELNCIYAVETALGRSDAALPEVCQAIVREIPAGWQFAEFCRAEIELNGAVYREPGWNPSPWVQSADIIVNDVKVGAVRVYYTHEMPASDMGPFLKEEARLVNSIASRLSHFLVYRQVRAKADSVQSALRDLQDEGKSEWRVVLDLLRQTDDDLFGRVAHKMLIHLSWKGIDEAQNLMRGAQFGSSGREALLIEEPNRPHRDSKYVLPGETNEETFQIAARHLSSDEILICIQKWIQEDKLSFVTQVVNRHLTLPAVVDALSRHNQLGPGQATLQSPVKRGVEVALIRRFFSDQLEFINIAKNFITLEDFYPLVQNIIYGANSHGKLGGKGAGLFLARQILRKYGANDPLLAELKIPRTWWIASDVILEFMHYNDLDDIIEQKYKEISLVRQEYPHIVQAFKRSRFPPDILKGLSVALDDFGDCPLIVRSSSLLEDRVGAAFSGKYKSLFLANQGTKADRLEALTDAIAEVYASVFGPDPIEYRTERGLIDFGEEMGIMIQQVVGTRMGPYFMPLVAGVAFSRNEFRWSPRIRREDGLLRLVPGLGTRAVDRLSDDYPVLIAPGHPGLRANATVEEILRYSPRKIDLINLEKNTFETVEIASLLHDHGDDYPQLRLLVSVVRDGQLLQPRGFDTDIMKGETVVTFAGLVADTPFVKRIRNILAVLEDNLKTPVDMEFASDGKDFYLLQCRAQSYSPEFRPASIPKNIPRDRIVFSANRFVSNGHAKDITHIVYVDPSRYVEVAEHSTLLAVGRAIGKLNKLLPKRQFILIGPGRWGSRGDIKLGVNVTYSDINNTAALIEVARKRGNYVPDLSFGTHFFQDLVESRIHYLPLYPDDDTIIFNEQLLAHSPSILGRVLPEFAELSETVRLIDVPQVTDGMHLQLLMNGDLGEALAILAHPSPTSTASLAAGPEGASPVQDHWHWRFEMAQRIAEYIDAGQLGVVGLYLIGSTKNGTAGASSDIDLLVHFRGDETQQCRLKLWLDGWSLCLDEMNYHRTGHRRGGLLDVLVITDDDIANQTGLAAKIDAVTDAARPLRLGRSAH
ncbi:MAG: nucleotidyltransferase domain-containing protein [candidate division Zixibacteria bacterium]|nr:nucleotidyltransferase domain-containing protein [candidate division Zixibacteria bacterium]